MAGRKHRVPPSDRTMQILEAQRAASDSATELPFPNGKGKPYNDMTFTMLLRAGGIPSQCTAFVSRSETGRSNKPNFCGDRRNHGQDT